ncbi:AfsR/SARP family transcriptional regulator [Saccharothrix sp. NRRL B-16314]|uniref:AfsR/SARP family transcriptional regulator n=1 Tax=Saccharothrix sp. NRRL B-16314 TaxID=1463825 RepID=UPI001E57D3E9|nr:AfsR/SARP family transcriptional regulator [Saccharothrix sp. NRRL B-16314]
MDLGSARQRCVLAALAVDAGRVVSTDRLIERIWGDGPPLRVRATLLTYLSRLRRVLSDVDGADIVRRSGGYLLDVDSADVDLHLFRALCARARGVEDVEAVALLREAARLWCGEALTGLGGDWALAERDRLHQDRVNAESDLADALLRLGHGEDLVPELFARAAANPVDERVARQYMLALHRAGRPADALEHYRQFRVRLVENLGTDPGAPLQRLHRRILDADPSLTEPAPPTASQSASQQAPQPAVELATPVPRQLPPAPPHFTGRCAELAVLDASALDGVRRTVGITAITGAAGMGKTWLALHWAHHNADRFPDGQLYVDFGRGGKRMSPAVAVRGFLDALGVAPNAIPPDPQARIGLYRSLVADKRLLVVADNVRSADQVVPLLPGSPTCMVVVTSRDGLIELFTRHGGRALPVDRLSWPAARDVLTARLGRARLLAEPEAVEELLVRCGGFPLALGVVACRAAADPRLPLAALAAELRTATRRRAAVVA